MTSFAKLELPEILRGMSTGPCWQGIYHDDHDDGDDDKSAIGNPERDVYRAMLARYLSIMMIMMIMMMILMILMMMMIVMITRQ